ncbi:4Fe-4S binding protein [Methanolobus sp. ZRKC2]|uniref:4Fe-4S binding protein n=1 Tax=Methanolobus sp. ZRKC2 TaxID=3125783 RepID=UPI00324BF2C2
MKDINDLLSSSSTRKKVERFRLFLQLAGLAIFVYFGSQSTIYVILLSVPLALLFGPVYCGWMCPRGLFQDIFARVGSKTLGKRYNVAVPRRFHPFLMYSRYILLLFVLMTLILSVLGVLQESIEILILEGLVAIMIFSILLSLFVDRAACKYFCKEGAVGGLLNLVSRKKVTRDTSLCNSCGICDRVCPMWIKVSKKHIVTDHSCVCCFKCIQACPVCALHIKE